MAKVNQSRQEHYFASSHLNWSTDADLLKCLVKQKKADLPKSGYKASGCHVYRVPLPPGAHYEINEYKPVVKGVEYISTITY